MTDFCVECGSEDVEVPPLCRKCHLKHSGVEVHFPRNVKVKVCPECGRQSPRGGRIRDMGDVERAVESEIDRRVEVSGSHEYFQTEVTKMHLSDGRAGKAAARVTVYRNGMKFDRTTDVTVYVGEAACEECSLKRGGFYEALVQVRGTDRDMTQDEMAITEAMAEERLDAMRDRGVQHSFLTKSARQHGGIDLYIGGAGAGRTIAEEVARTFSTGISQTTSSLYGEKDGRRLYRVTYLVRLAKARVGDIIELNGRILQILRGRNHYDLVDLRSGDGVRMPREELEKGVVVATQDDLKPAVVVSIEGRTVLLVHPETSVTVEVRMTADVAPGTVEVWTCSLHGELLMAYRTA